MGYEGHAVAVRDRESRVLETQKAMSVLNDQRIRLGLLN